MGSRAARLRAGQAAAVEIGRIEFALSTRQLRTVGIRSQVSIVLVSSACCIECKLRAGGQCLFLAAGQHRGTGHASEPALPLRVGMHPAVVEGMRFSW